MPNASYTLKPRHVVLALSAAVLVAIGTFLLLASSGGSAKASVPSPESLYAALGNTEPTGLPVVTDGTPTAKALGAKGPTFSASPPSGFVGPHPEASSIRKLQISLPSYSAWIAKSSDGGICVLTASHTPVKPGVYALGGSCSEASAVQSGATGEEEVEGSKTVTIVGVVPNGVTSVQVKITDGTTQTVPVVDNAWALQTAAHAETITRTVGG